MSDEANHQLSSEGDSRRKFLKRAVVAGSVAAAAGLYSRYPLKYLGLDSASASSRTSVPIKHWIIIMQENRTFDCYFNGYPGANSAYSGGVPTTNQNDCGANHHETAAAHDWDNGSMTIANFLANEPATESCPSSDDWTPMHYYPNTVPGVSEYWTLAKEFTLCDNFFSSWMGYSLPNHLINISANVGGDDPPTSPTIPPLGSIKNSEFPTMPDLLNATGISWRYYGTYKQKNLTDVSSTDGEYWCSLQYWSNYASDFKSRCVPNTNILTDVTNPESDFPEVAWVCAPPTIWSEHPPFGPESGYNNWTGPIISKVMANTELWSSCAIVLCWDDYGGYYDHVPPPGISPAPIPPPQEQVDVSHDPDTYYYGFRCPALLISPYSKGGSVDHTIYNPTSFLKTLEVQYDLPSLGGLDKVANDFLGNGAFDFDQTPRSANGIRSFHAELAAKQAPRWIGPKEYRHVAIPFGEEIENE